MSIDVENHSYTKVGILVFPLFEGLLKTRHFEKKIASGQK